MLVNWIRKYIGGVRLALTVTLLMFSLQLIILDISGLKVSKEVYLFLGGLFAQASVFIYAETKTKTNGHDSNPHL